MSENVQEMRQPRTQGCCPPRAMLWIDSRSSQIFVENAIQQSTRLDVRAANSQTTTPPPPGTAQTAASDSELIQSVMKAQGKIFLTHIFTIHWASEGHCRPLALALEVTGAVSYDAHCLPETGEVTLSRSYLLEPPSYALPPGPDDVFATLDVTDCSGLTAHCENSIERPFTSP